MQVPYPTLHRFAVGELGFGRKQTTVRLADGEPGSELQVDFGKMGLLHDPATGRPVCQALIFTAGFSRHQFVWLTFTQSFPSVIAGFEAAWRFFSGAFRVLIPDNLKAIVDRSDPLDPRINEAFLEYAQSRGFAIDPARIRHPKDKARVERQVTYVRESMWKGEDLRDLEDAQRHAERWCLETAGMRIHRTTRHGRSRCSTSASSLRSFRRRQTTTTCRSIGTRRCTATSTSSASGPSTRSRTRSSARSSTSGPTAISCASPTRRAS